jgi:hypothetical protein
LLETCILYPSSQCRYDCLGDFILDYKDVVELAVVAFGPKVNSGRRIYKLGGDAHTLTRPSETAFKEI